MAVMMPKIKVLVNLASIIKAKMANKTVSAIDTYRIKIARASRVT